MNGGSCFICGDVNDNRHQVHHIVPRRFDGSSEDENLVTLCASCHQAVEKMYDARFYDELGVKRDIGGDTPDKVCDLESCTATAGEWLDMAEDGERFAVCEGHTVCQFEDCSRTAEFTLIDHPSFQGSGAPHVAISCSEHHTCSREGCQNRETYLVDSHPEYAVSHRKPYCDTHGWELISDE